MSKINISLKNIFVLETKKKLNLALNVLIAILGISSLFIKFFLVDGVLAFRAFTVDGNLFTTLVTIAAVFFNLKALKTKDDLSSKRLFYFELASAVTEAVIFIVVMIGYLPIFDDNPTITPYHMFCLHVAIPVLAVVRFIVFEKPQGIIKPNKLLIGAIPIAVYGIGVITAIKVKLLPISLVPYSFLNFEDNFLWFAVFALVVIPTFGYLWSWMFYRLNIRCSLLWYKKSDIEKLKAARIEALSRFDTVNTSILLVYCCLALVLLMFSLMGTSTTSTKIQHEMTSYISYYMLDDYDHMLGNEEWHMKDGALYKGDMLIGDGTDENANPNIFTDDVVIYDISIFAKADQLSPEIAANTDSMDYVCVKHSSGAKSPINQCGDVLDKATVAAIYTSDDYTYFTQEKIGKQKYYHYCTTFGSTLYSEGVGIISLYIPVKALTTQAKNAEYNHDIMMITVVTLIFAVLYIVTNRWIRILERSYKYVKQIAVGCVPEAPIVLGGGKRIQGLENELNALRDSKKE